MPQDIFNLDLPENKDIDLFAPVDMPEKEKGFEFDTAAINEAIAKGTDAGEDDKRRLINLHIASLTNQNPNKMNYDAAVKSYFHGDAADSSVDQVFQKLQGAIKPEIDADYKALEEFQSLTEEEQLKKIITSPEKPSDYGISVGGMGAVYIPSAAKDETPQDRQAKAIAGMSQEEKDAAITKHGMGLLGKSRRAMIETGEKVLSPLGRRMADKMSLGKEMSLAEYNQLTGMDKKFIFQYTRAINPAVDASVFSHLTERIKQTLVDGGESMVRSGQRVADQKDSPQRVYEEFMTGFDAAELNQFTDLGEWSSPEFEAQADVVIDEIAEGMIPHAYSQSRIKMGESSEELRAQVKEDIKAKLKPELQKKLYEGRELANQFKLDRAVKSATRKLFKSGAVEDIVVEGTAVLTDMGVAILAGIPTAGAGTVAYSASRVYGDFVNTLIYDHNVDPDDAIAIGTVGTAVYAGIELAQTKTLMAPFKKTSAKVKGFQSEMTQKFMAGLPDFAKKIATNKSPVMQGIRETAKTYTLETAEESLQAMTEQLMKAYAKEFAEAEGVEYSELVGDWFDETLSAMKGMALMSVGRGVIRTGKEMGGYDNQTMKDNILKDPGNLDFKTISDDFAKLPQELQEELQEAETREDIQAIFDENNIVMKAEDFQSFQDLQSEVGVEVDTQKQKLRQEVEQKSADVDVDYIDVNRDLKKVEVKAQAQSFIKPMSEYVDLLEPTPGNFVIKSKANNNSVQLEFAEVESGVAGQYSEGKIILPANAKDFTFNHEMFHGMFDLGVITADEQRTLIKSAIRRLDTDAISDRYKDKYNQVKSSLLKEFEAEGKTDAAFMIDEIAPEFTSAIQNEEFMAHLVEQAAKDPNFFKDMSPDEKTVWQKLIDFIKSLYSSQYRSELKSEKATAETVKRNRRKEAEADKILQSILTGEVMSREGPQSQVDMDDVYASEYDADIADEINYMMGQIEPDAAVESRLKEDAEREEATAELFKTSVAPVNEVKLFLADRTFKFDEKFKEEVEQLSPAEKRRINKFEDAESSVSSDNVFDELVEATILDDTATVTEMIEQLARPVDTKFSLAPDTDTEAFKNWFGDSKVVNDDGSPKVVYHGGLDAKDISIFSADFAGYTTGNNEHGAFYFSSDDSIAEDYSKQAFIRRYEYRDLDELIEEGFSEEYAQSLIDDIVVGAQGKDDIIPAYINMQNPYILDMEGEMMPVAKMQDIIGFLKDGIYPEQYPEIQEEINESADLGYSDSDKADYFDEIEERARENEDLQENDDIEDYMLEDAAREILEENDIYPEAPSYDGIIVKNTVDNISPDSAFEQDVYIAFEPTQIKSATENVGTFDPANADIRYSIPGASDKDLAAISLAGHQFETKKAFTQNQLNKALDDLGIINETERLEVIQRADTILNELNESKSELSNHREITEALIEANLNAEYQEGLSRIERESFKGGKTYERAAAKLKERAKIARLADTQDLEPDKIAYLINEYQKSITENEDSSRLLPSIKDAIRENMIKSGLITERNKKGFEKMPEYRATLGKTLYVIANNLIYDLTAGRNKTNLDKASDRLRKLNTAKSIENNFMELIYKISKSKTKEKAILDKELKAILKPYSSLPEEGIEERKRTVSAQKHLFLYYANKF